MKEQSDIAKALWGRKKGGRIRVKEDPALRMADGIVFASRHEMAEYLKLKSLERCGVLTELKLQVPFVVMVTDPRGNLQPVFKYIADFVVKDRDGVTAVYDAKGMRTDVYKLKKKAVEAQYGIRIVEI